MEQINYKLEVFEGPMDLLLSLISKHKLDIYDIPIMELVEQYTDYVRRMQEADMDVASEFLEMAARLVYIKTVSLLPKSEEAEELKRELTGELLEYRDCQIMAGKLKDTAGGFELYTKATRTSTSPSNCCPLTRRPSENGDASSRRRWRPSPRSSIARSSRSNPGSALS